LQQICPISGRNLRDDRRLVHRGAVPVDQKLVDHLVATTGLTQAEAARVAEDVLAYHQEPVEAYVRRRHAELRIHGVRNPEIFGRLAEELAHRVVAAPELSERQLRRIVYG
jgi:polyhydroxyalkanoate synthesis regulator phasin